MTADHFKACCVNAYQHEATALLLGGAYHPGGRPLTRTLADRLVLKPRQRVLDVASGPGGTALLLAREYGVLADGVDLGPENVAKATAAAASAGLDDRVRFHVGDAERLPFPDGTFDAAVCECAFCTFPDKSTAAAEFARVLRPGGRLGLTDITIDPAHLDDRLKTLAGRVACIADAGPSDEYARLLTDAGLHVTRVERHDEALTEMIDRIEARVRALRITCPSGLTGLDVGLVLEMTSLARDAARRGVAGYVLLVAEKEATA